MVIDTSAVLAVSLAEEDAQRYARAIETAEACRMSAASFLEAAAVIDNQGDAVASREFDALPRRAGIHIEAVTFEQAQIARLPRLRPGPPPGGAQLRGLPGVCAGEGAG